MSAKKRLTKTGSLFDSNPELLSGLKDTKSPHNKILLKFYDSEQAKEKEDKITSIHHSTSRAYKTLPQIIKSGLFDPDPPLVVDEDTGLQVYRKRYNLGKDEASFTYNKGPAGLLGMLVFIAVTNKACRLYAAGKDVTGFDYPLPEICEDLGIAKDKKNKRYIKKALIVLQNINCLFESGFVAGGSRFFDSFSLIQQVTIRDTEETNHLDVSTSLPVLKKIRPRTHIRLSNPIIEAIKANIITTLDMWALKSLKSYSCASLFIILWDISQWSKRESVKFSIMDLSEITSIKLYKVKSRQGKAYPSWGRLHKDIDDVVSEVESVAKFIRYVEIDGEKDKCTYTFHFTLERKQLPQRNNQ